MREIRFRGKRITDRKWAYGFLVVEPNGTSWISKHFHRGEWEQVSSETVGQFTGLKDDRPEGEKLEIYERDLIKATKGGWSREFEIIWKEDQARFMAWEASQPNISFDLTRETIIELHVIVIGSVYPNPEPLEVIQ